MEARLAKMRVVGLKYDSGNIHTDDLKLDFTIPESMPGHAAYILRNGGGKGVFFQTLFQTLDPLTSWKKDLNHVHHFFFNDEDRPIEYTFHIVQEWQVSLSKRVILGIAVTPRLVSNDKKSQTNSPIELDYFLYTMEPLVIEMADIFELQLWNEKEKEAVPFNTWKEAIKSDKSFHFYSKQDRDSYIEKIEEYGYDTNTVNILKRINDGEGGFGEFFKGSTDNTGLFYNLLIPTINDKIEGIDSRNKKEVSVVTSWFLEALKISKELPDLLAMVDSIEQINDFILPLQDRFREGEEIKQSVEIWENKGSELLQLLMSLMDYKENQVTKLEKEQTARKEQRDIARWKYANIDYIVLHQERDEVDGQYYELEHEQLKADLALKGYQTQLIKEKVNLELKRRMDKLDEIEANNQSISTLMDSEDLKEATAGLKEIREYFNKKWESISESWQKEMNRNARSILAHETKIQQLKMDMDSESKQKRDLEFKAYDLSNAIDQFEKKLEEACIQYGAELPYQISDIIDETRMELTQVKTAFESASKSQSILENEILDTRIDLARQEDRVKAIGSEIKQVENESIVATQKENELIANVSKILKTHYPFELERESYYEIRKDLENYLEKTKDAHKEQLRKMWTFQEDIHLIEEGDKIGSYIPNSDLLKVKQLLDAHRIESMYGSEYLHHLSREEKQYELERNPALRYSVVILEESFESLNLSFIEQELIRSHVVLVDKTKSSKKDKQSTANPFLDKQDEMNYLFKDLSYSFLEDEYEFEQWKVMVEKNADDADHEVGAFERKIEQIEKVSKELEVLLSGILKTELALKLLNLQTEEKKQTNILSDIKVQLEEKEGALNKKLEEVESLSNKLEVLEKNEKELLLLENELEQDKENRKTKSNFLKLIEETENGITQLEEEKGKITIQKTNNSASFSNWMGYVRSNYSTLRRMLGDIQMPVAAVIDTFDEKQDLRSHSYGHSLSKEARENIIKYHELDKNISNKNMRLAELNQTVKTLQEQVIKHENILQDLYGNSWSELSVPESDEMHLATLVTQAEKQRDQGKAKVDGIMSKMKYNREEIEKLEKRLEDKRKDMEKDYPRFGAEYIEIPDWKAAKEQYRKERNLLERQYSETREEITKLHTSIEGMEQTTRLLKDLKLPVHPAQVLSEQERVIIHENPIEYFTKWNQKYNSSTTNYRSYQENLGKRITQIKEKIESFTNIPETYQKELVHFLSTIRDMSFDDAVASLNNYLDWAKNNLQDELEQKEKADKAVDLCAERQSRRVLDVINVLQDLVRKLTIINWKKERFPLIKYNKNFPFPTKLEDIKPLVKELCMNEIDFYVSKYKDKIDNFTVHDIVKTMNISKLVLKAMGDFPRLMIHIPDIEGGLLRGEAKHAVYKEWETINQGSVTSSTKSGGQTLLAHFIVIAMIMRQRVEENSPLFLVTDNPFGTMSAPELVEGVFSLLDLLNIQWLVVAPPITNVSITSKFPTINNMNIEVVEGRKVLEKKLVKNYRKYLQNFSVLDNPEEKDHIS
ncbi:hypothetical protein [Neobacillus massiliamazoniensis]|uniref:Chromosome segregation ATPase n=1 Tax=Neobacillus massiliamazoniensis TaxID=1499688 RepID=A0A0U1P4H1_9BACI|nr:hypothetical protein [Neobacillus massiliamazoniensis]CRK85229.1 hypothetical protein BN000_05301 [Neobacillus massiliamazoniensis]